MKKGRGVNSISNFLIFFLLVAFVVTCNLLLFLAYADVEREELVKSGPLTLLNVLFISFVFCLIDMFRRHMMITRPVKRIQEGLARVMKGDFATHIEPINGQDSDNEFDVIIRDLNKMIEELSGVETLRTDFIANVSHELKTPLTVMQNYGVLLQSPDLSEEQRIEYGKAIQEQTKRLSTLITNILKLNKLENQQIYPNVETYYLNEQLCECMLEFESVWDKKNIEIETELDEDIQIEGDKELLSLVWNNLLSNALKFTDEGGKVTMSLTKDEEFAYVKVQDSGCGMSAETGRNIFKKFYQGDTSHATKGNGLGLALVKRVIDICGGEISVSSVLGEGSTFTVKIRRAQNG